MAKLLPPLVEGTIPAFYNNNGIVNITIPFSMNRAVSKGSVKGFSIKVKTAQNSTYLYSTEITNRAYFDLSDTAPSITLRVSQDTQAERDFLSKIREGQYYKFQIAYIDYQDDIGYFSTVTVGKYTKKPNRVEILNLNRNAINSRSYSYTGFYNNNDITERVYSYRFDLYDQYYKLKHTTGDQLHNSENDTTASESYDSCDLLLELEVDKVYYLQYSVTTSNNLTIKSSRYRIAQRETLEPEITTNLIAVLNSEDGYIELSFDGEEEASGSYMLMRSCSDSNFEIWDKIHTFRLVNKIPKEIDVFRDFTFEQGKTYQYSLVQFNQYNLYSNKIYSNKIYADFEYAFLFDGKRQLKIKYNTKVASLKPTVLEQKVDTIGGQYPFIFRNGSVYYKEFSVSGLISFLSDENGLFSEAATLIDFTREATPSELDLEYKSRTHPSAENFYKERNFKTEVINWLTNGETKLFRSPSEGNFIVRLTNTSLTPNDQLGRMLHTFTSTAYEVADFNYANLVNYNFLRIAEAEELANSIMHWKTIDLTQITNISEQINNETALTFSFTNMTPGDRIRFFMQSGTQTDVIIGSTGEYTVSQVTPVRSIYVLQHCASGQCTYSFYNTKATNFDVISNIYYLDAPASQFIGETEDLRREFGLVYKNRTSGKIATSTKRELIKIYYLKATLRNWAPLFSNGAIYYVSPFDDNSLLVKPNPILLYREVPKANIADKKDTRPLVLEEEDFIVPPSRNSAEGWEPCEVFHDFNRWKSASYFDRWESGLGGSGATLGTSYYAKGNESSPQYGTCLYLYYDDDNPQVVDLYHIKEFYTDKIDELPRIKMDCGVVAEIGYQIKVTDYVIEDRNSNIATWKNNLKVKEKTLASYVHEGKTAAIHEGNPTPIRDEYQELLQDIKNTREQFYTSLDKALQEEEEMSNG